MSAAMSRTAAVALLAVLIGGLAAALVVPGWGLYRSNLDEIEALRERLDRFSALAAAREELGRTLAALEQRGDRGRYLLAPGSPALAGAALQERLETAAAASGGRVVSTQVRPAEGDGAFRRVTVNVQLLLDATQLQSVLHAVESQAPYVVVDRFRATSRRRRQRQQTDQPVNLDVRFRMSGFMRLPEADAPGAPGG